MKIPSAKIVFNEQDKKEILKTIEESLTTGQLTLGKNGTAFEEEFRKTTQTQFAVAVNSGTSSLEIILRALNLQGKEVLVPTNTFFATAAAVWHAGAVAKFVDMNSNSLSFDMDILTRNVSKKTGAVIIVHIGGIVTPDMPELVNFCNESGIYLIEDAAHAHGSTLNGKAAGGFGVASSFSFYPTKVITAGEGGMIATNDPRIVEEAKKYRDQGKASFLENKHDRLGYNWRMSELHAAVGKVHLRHLSEFVEERRKIAKKYDEGLKRIKGIKSLPVDSGCRSNYYKYIAILEKGIDRAQLKKALREKHNVSLSGEVYELPCHLQPIFQNGYKKETFPNAEEFCRRHICLPVYQGMTDAEVGQVLLSLETELK
ncbi:MAG: DegT/DnrJ/EryC1/StrS family aminotransferase [Candidatus Omnitrophica bacterium]|nr:DegT/DnrJ/EryC1/StrS family aminotransferase [Candidatus Omnitrophota bacterium]